MGLELQRGKSFPIYDDGRVFDWVDHNYYLELGDYSVINRHGDYWEVFHSINDFVNSQRLSTGSKEFCMKSVEHQIRQDEMD